MNTKIVTKPGLIKNFFSLKESAIIILILLLTLITQISNPVFLSGDNIVNILRSCSFVLITALGMTFVMIAGGIDLSVGSVVGLGGVVTGFALQAGLGSFVSVALGLIAGMIIGFVNGYFIVKFNIAPMIMTLGTLYIARGIIYVLTEGVPVYPLPSEFQAIEQGTFLYLPNICWIAFVLAGIAYFMLTKTTTGRAIYAVGGNVEAARLSGIKVEKIKYLIYTISALFSALTGIFMASRLASAQAGAGTGFEMTVIAAVVIGGTSTFGGIGTIFGTVIGVLFTNMLSNAMTILKISLYWQTLVIGLILVFAVAVDGYKRSKSKAS
ncbi:ABC transporter permease [Petroclostridium sp. X23]|uniref:ABC transporter permease n=1 Tax=Petroclostridium sp. X23 TaxID=3045146 RepID=UPI0024AE8649|nr:ABC transporter permease [Petroclostridium sp. X23]WHH60748.1 ABC transporter permease [Petroclostridium sp. X23]